MNRLGRPQHNNAKSENSNIGGTNVHPGCLAFLAFLLTCLHGQISAEDTAAAAPPPFVHGHYYVDVTYSLGRARGPVIAELFDPSLAYVNAARLSLAQNRLKNVYGGILFLGPPRPKARIESYSIRAEYALTGAIGLGLSLNQNGLWLQDAPKAFLGIPLRDLGAFIPLSGGPCDGIVNPGNDCNPGLLDTWGIQRRTRKASNINTLDFFAAYHRPGPSTDFFARASLGVGRFSGQQVVKGGLSAGVRLGEGPYLVIEPFANYYYFAGRTPSDAERSIRESGARIGVSFGFGN